LLLRAKLIKITAHYDIPVLFVKYQNVLPSLQWSQLTILQRCNMYFMIVVL